VLPSVVDPESVAESIPASVPVLPSVIVDPESVAESIPASVLALPPPPPYPPGELGEEDDPHATPALRNATTTPMSRFLMQDSGEID
jgi:hypothetical protein